MSETDTAKYAYAVVFERGPNNYSAYAPMCSAVWQLRTIGMKSRR